MSGDRVAAIAAERARQHARVLELLLEYPLRWRKVSRHGYGYVELVPCRLIHRGRKRATIAALRADGSEAVRSVDPANVLVASTLSSDGASG